MLPDQGIEISSLPMHTLAEEIPDDGIFELNSPLGSGRGCLQVVFNLKYFNNAIHTISHVVLIIQRRKFWARKFWQITCNSSNSPKFPPSNILYPIVYDIV